MHTQAHPSLHNLLLQVFDEGRLTDSHGRVIDFRHSVVLLTANLGFSSGGDASSEDVEAALRMLLAPELINRLDDTICFNRLTRDDMNQIVQLRLDEVNTRLQEQRICLEVCDRAKAALAEASYDPHYGARPLRRIIQRDVLNPLAKLLLSGSVKQGDVVRATVDDAGNVVVLPNHASSNAEAADDDSSTPSLPPPDPQ